MKNSEKNTRRSARLFFTLLGMSVLVAVVVCTVTIVRALPTNAEYDWFRHAYGPSRNSQYAEEWLIRDFFGDQRNGFFVDVGAHDYKRFNNTYYLENILGWSGLAIDAQEEFAADYAKYRPRSRFFAFFVSDKSDGVESLFVPAEHPLVASSSKEFSDRYDTSSEERRVPTITLNDLLARTGVTAIDFLTMDIELAEPRALAGFDVLRYRPRLVCVEAHPEIRQQLIDYFSERGYRVVGRYLRADPYNLWFAPADSAFPKGVQVADAH